MFEEPVVTINRQIDVAMVAVCYFILLCIGTQMFAVVNQRRYRSGFWLSFATLLLSILLVFVAMKATCIKVAYFNEDKMLTDDQHQEIMKENHYLFVLPIVALLQLAFFTRRPFQLFGPVSSVAAQADEK